MKKSRKIISIVLSTLMFSALTACGGAKKPTATETTQEPAEHKVTTTLHKGVNDLKDTGMSFIKDKKTDYQIVVGTESSMRKAASYIVSQIFSATGASIKTETDPVWSSSEKYIVIGEKALESAAGVSMPKEDIGMTGYEIKTVGNSVFILANGEQGYHLGALAFLRATIGYLCISADTIVYTKSGEVMPEMDIIERPDFDYRVNNSIYTHSAELAYPMGVQADGTVMIPVDGVTVHNSFAYLPPNKYETAHPDWYSKERATVSPWNSGGYAAQFCYTVHGNNEEKAQMQNLIADMIVEKALASDKHIITLTQQDDDTYCTCDSCKAIVDEYGSISAAVIRFVNGVDDIVQEKLQRYATEHNTEKKELIILFFAYQATKEPPTKIDDTVKCNDTVGIYCASSKTKYAYTFYDEINEKEARNMTNWGKLGKLYLWLYESNSMDYFVPCNNFQAVLENYRFCKSIGASYVFSQQNYRAYTTGFVAFKEYINSRAWFDVNVDFSELHDTFFRYYYGEGGQYMEQFFDEMTTYMTYMRDQGYSDFYGCIINEFPAQTKYWSFGMVKRWNDLCNDALEAVEKYKTSNYEYYLTLRDHINLDSLFPRYLLCTLFDGKYSETEISAMRKAFKADCEYFNNGFSSEYVAIDGLWQSWGI